MQGFGEAQDDFTAAGAQILSMSIDSWASTNAFGITVGAEFPMLGDWPLNTVSKAYDVYKPDEYIAKRVTYVMDADHIIRGVIEDERDVRRHVTESLALVRELAAQETES